MKNYTIMNKSMKAKLNYKTYFVVAVMGQYVVIDKTKDLWCWFDTLSLVKANFTAAGKVLAQDVVKELKDWDIETDVSKIVFKIQDKHYTRKTA